MELEFPKSLISIYTHFRDKIYNPNSVFYPCCGGDASPAQVFSNVTFLDTHSKSIDALRKAGCNAINLDLRDYKHTEKHDLLLLQNSGAPAEWATPHLINKGYVISNNYGPGGTAKQLFENKEEFDLLMRINCRREVQGGVHIVDFSSNLEGLFEPTKDIAEFERCRPEDFEFEQRMMRSFSENGTIDCSPNASEADKWVAYIKEMWHGKMPAKRTANYYLFRKK